MPTPKQYVRVGFPLTKTGWLGPCTALHFVSGPA